MTDQFLEATEPLKKGDTLTIANFGSEKLASECHNPSKLILSYIRSLSDTNADHCFDSRNMTFPSTL